MRLVRLESVHDFLQKGFRRAHLPDERIDRLGNERAERRGDDVLDGLGVDGVSEEDQTIQLVDEREE